MAPIDISLFPILTGSTGLIIKSFFVVGASIYLFFSFVVIRQIALMRATVITPISPFVTILGYAHLIIAALVFISYLFM